MRFPCSPSAVDKETWMKGNGEGGGGGGSCNRSSLHAADSSVLDFWVGQVIGEIVSVAQLINGSAGSIYLCLRQSCWEMGMVKWESTACLSSPQLPSGHFTPTNPSLKGGMWGETDKYKASREPSASALCISSQLLRSFQCISSKPKENRTTLLWALHPTATALKAV